jgi:hypothetical protein
LFIVLSEELVRVKVTNIYNENGKTLQEVMEEFLILFYYDYTHENVIIK